MKAIYGKKGKYILREEIIFLYHFGEVIKREIVILMLK